MFFIKKKDGSLRLVQDYRALNAITVKNKYPLPLILELINKLQGARYFTKLDIHWGFNNIWMKDGDEWKATFRTNQGLYEPLVMFFGLTNSLATFQTMMDCTKPREGWKRVWWRGIEITISTFGLEVDLKESLERAKACNILTSLWGLLKQKISLSDTKQSCPDAYWCV